MWVLNLIDLSIRRKTYKGRKIFFTSIYSLALQRCEMSWLPRLVDRAKAPNKRAKFQRGKSALNSVLEVVDSMTRAHFGHASRDGVLFIHGGQSPSGRLQSDLVAIVGPDPTANVTSPVGAGSGSGGLSHHASVVLRNKFLVSIGGWDGKKRSSGVMVADLDNLVKGMEPFVLMNTKACCEV